MTAAADSKTFLDLKRDMAEPMTILEVSILWAEKQVRIANWGHDGDMVSIVWNYDIALGSTN